VVQIRPWAPLFPRKSQLFSIATQVNDKPKCAQYAGFLSIAVTQL